MTDPLRHNATLVDSLGTSMRRGGSALANAPLLLRQVLEENAWREFVTQRGDHVSHSRFSDFVTALPLKGLGADMAVVRRISADDPKLLDLIDRAEGSRQGQRSDLVNNVHEVARPAGNSGARALRKLRKDAPDLHAEVLANRMSAHAAMVQAGFRRKTFSVPADDPVSAARSLRKHMTPEQVAELRGLLTDD